MKPKMLNKRGKSDPFYSCITLLGCLLLFCLLMLLLLFRRNFFLVQVRGGSMQDTLFGDDLLYAQSTLYTEPKRGDIVIVDVTDHKMYASTNKNEDGRTLIIKRLIAIEGDSVKCRNGIVYLKKAGEEEFLPEEDERIHYKTPDFEELTLGEGEIFVLGDHREDSLDSQDILRFEGMRQLRYSEIKGVVSEWVAEHVGLIEKLESFRTFMYR